MSRFSFVVGRFVSCRFVAVSVLPQRANGFIVTSISSYIQSQLGAFFLLIL